MDGVFIAFFGWRVEYRSDVRKVAAKKTVKREVRRKGYSELEATRKEEEK
ncbi:MAG: hypothetical protein ACLR23_04320 [Clostridia bacterium]